ncbi:putative Nuclear protein skip [Heracleum sosnowskyi]|uniref:Nuclear protein skip n=1 Tax=Heracleum sosnowskyi TaxID=360622 RepID=A0AAD8HZI1_9APIA|nr:putative Nuclear protein skip [Heracleum sosnowskyi]
MERRLEEKDVVMGKKSKITRDKDRDVSEKIALGMASTGGRGEVMMYDTRLFNQEKGMDLGFATDDQYNVYDEGLFSAQGTLFTLHRPKKDYEDKVMKTDRFKPDRPFVGTSIKSGPRNSKPVAFEEEFDLFGLNQFFTEIENDNNNMGKIGSSSTMTTGCCSSMQDGYRSGSSSGHNTPLLA